MGKTNGVKSQNRTKLKILLEIVLLLYCNVLFFVSLGHALPSDSPNSLIKIFNIALSPLLLFCIINLFYTIAVIVYQPYALIAIIALLALLAWKKKIRIYVIIIVILLNLFQLLFLRDALKSFIDGVMSV